MIYLGIRLSRKWNWKQYSNSILTLMREQRQMGLSM